MNFDKYIEISLQQISLIQSPKKHTSFIIRKNNILSMGINTFKTHPQLQTLGYRFLSTHSELAARLKLNNPELLNRATLINIRLSVSSVRLGRPVLRMSRPCKICMGWIFDSGIKTIYYSTNDGFEKISL